VKKSILRKSAAYQRAISKSAMNRWLRFGLLILVSLGFISGGHNYYAKLQSQGANDGKPVAQVAKIERTAQVTQPNATPIPTQSSIVKARVNDRVKAQTQPATASPKQPVPTQPASTQPAPIQQVLPPQALQAPPAAPELTAQLPQSAPALTAPAVNVATKHGHFPYDESPGQSLVGVGNGQSLHAEGAAAMQQMVQVAKQSGVYLVAVSGFRDVTLQQDLFEAQINRRGSVAAAAKISAPPGYSEHHTGYAIDFGDRDRPQTDVEETFEQTPAFQWLIQNAYQYGFEMSFPRGNLQGVMYEPWHWRFVGSQRAQQVFAPAR
jgi:zinc D-Ala-D-Ala carboxypeptidase